MTKTKTLFFCRECGGEHPKWQGQCSHCGVWNSLTEEIVLNKKLAPRVTHYAGSQSALTLLKDVQLQAHQRLSTGVSEFDHVLGGGLVSGSVILIGGDPGVGKSTLLLQILSTIAKNYRALYVTGEESLQQIAMRAQRLEANCDALTLLAETQVEQV